MIFVVGSRLHLRASFLKSSPSATSFMMVSASASLRTGEKLTDERDLTEVLLKRKDLIMQNLIRQLLTYGTGREPSLKDKAEIDRIAEIVKRRRYGFRDLVSLVVTSKTFRQP